MCDHYGSEVEFWLCEIPLYLLSDILKDEPMLGASQHLTSGGGIPGPQDAVFFLNFFIKLSFLS